MFFYFYYLLIAYSTPSFISEGMLQKSERRKKEKRGENGKTISYYCIEDRNTHFSLSVPFGLITSLHSPLTSGGLIYVMSNLHQQSAFSFLLRSIFHSMFLISCSVFMFVGFFFICWWRNSNIFLVRLFSPFHPVTVTPIQDHRLDHHMAHSIFYSTTTSALSFTTYTIHTSLHHHTTRKTNCNYTKYFAKQQIR